MEAHTTPLFVSATDKERGNAAAPDRRINVLFLTIQISIGGAERLVLDLVRRLDRSLFAPSVGWFSHEAAPREFEELQIPLFPIKKGPGFDWSAMKRLGNIVREHRIDVINAHHFMSFFYSWHAARVANKVGLLYTEHSEADVTRATGAWRAIGAGLLRASDGAIGVSERVTETLVSQFWLNPSLARTIENGVDLDVFGNATIHRDDVRRAIGLAPSDIVIGHVANFRRNKNHLFLVKAFQRAFSHRQDVKLLLIGQGFPSDIENSQPDVTAFVSDNGLQESVRLLGYRPDVHDLLRAMDVFCLVSHKEGLPLSVIEAMASGLPVVATNIAGLRGVVRPEVNGVLVEPDDVTGLAQALGRLSTDSGLRHRFGDSARRIAHDKYSFARCLSETQTLLLSTACRRKAPRHFHLT